MTHRLVLVAATWIAMTPVIIGHAQSRAATPRAAASVLTLARQRALIDQYCVTCHSSRAKVGGLALDALDLARVASNAPVWEKVVRKVRAGVMPPPGQARPSRAAADGLASFLETSLDRAAAVRPNPGRTEAMHRLNRVEYQNATRDLLGVETDVASLLPADDASYGFDNIAGILRFSPTLMEKYLVAAGKVSRAAVGIAPTAPNFDVFRVSDELSQDDRLDGLPFGTRGGTLVRYTFPADGEYLVRVRLARQTAGQDSDVPRYDVPQQLEVSLDGDRLQVFTLAPSKPRPVRSSTNYGNRPQEQLTQGGTAAAPVAEPARRPAAEQDGDSTAESALGGSRNYLDADWQVRFVAKAGPRDVAVTWINRTSPLLETHVQPFFNPFPTGSNTWTPRKGAYVRSVEISGPFQTTGPGDTPSRRRIFVCRPARPSEEAGCAKQIVSTLARRAFRRPVTDADIQPLVASYQDGRADKGFDEGIALAIQRLLISPEFLFRVEAEPAAAAPDTSYRISDLELASRLSFFLWSSIPDDQLLDLAARGRLRNPLVLDQQVRRMLADGRSKAIVDNFVGQWLFLRNVPALFPDPYKDPDFDEGLRQALRRETELFVQSVMRDDRSVLELLTAKYTFVNERLAKHYGIANVQGPQFRRVAIPGDSPRAGLLGQGSILAVTSEPNRTSPVKRGKWILENILGTPPPDPPANVPPLEETGVTTAVTMRERMAEHRKNPACAGCHSMMDPLGLALENFDQAGRWRSVDGGVDSRRSAFTPIDASGVSPDGATFAGASGLQQMLLNRSERFVNTMTEKLLTYALGRGLEYFDAPAVRGIARDAARSNYRFSALVAAIVRSTPFQMRRASGDGSADVADLNGGMSR